MAKLVLNSLLALTLFTISALIIKYPEQFGGYLDLRIDGLSMHALELAKLFFVPLGRFSDSLSIYAVYSVSAFFALAGISVLIQNKSMIMIHACVMLIAGALIHLPFSKGKIGEYPAGQIRKLVFVIAFCTCMIMSMESDCLQSENKATAAALSDKDRSK